MLRFTLRSVLLRISLLLPLALVMDLSGQTPTQAAAAPDLSRFGPASPPQELHEAATPLRRVPAHQADARRLFDWAAAAGHVPSMVALAEMTAQGQGGPRDGDAAFALFRRAADTGDIPAMLRLAELQLRPQIGSFHYTAWRDLPAGLALFEKAAATGDANALVRLAQILESGTGGVRDIPRALETLEKALAAGRTDMRPHRDRVRDNLRLTPEQKLARYHTELTRAASHREPSQQRGFALSRYIGSIYGGGLDLAQTAALVTPVIVEMVETDFHALRSAREIAQIPWNVLIDRALTEDQRSVLDQIRRHNARHANVPAPEISPGQGWSAAYPVGTRPAIVATPPATPPAPAAPARPAAPQGPVLAAHFREASDWEAFFRAAATSPGWTLPSDVEAFRARYRVSTDELRAAYRRVIAGHTPSENSTRGEEFGKIFAAYHLSLAATGLSSQAAVNFAREDFLALFDRDVHAGFRALMTLPRGDHLQHYRDLLPRPLANQVRLLAQHVSDRRPLPDDAALAAARYERLQTHPNDFRLNALGFWHITTPALSGSGPSLVRFTGTGNNLSHIEINPLSANPTRIPARFENRTVNGRNQTRIIFTLGNNRHEGSANRGDGIVGTIHDANNRSLGVWNATKRLDFDYHFLARQALRDGDRAAAIHYFGEAIRIRNETDHLLGRAIIHFEVKDYAAALADYDAILRIAPGNTAALSNRFLSLHYAGNHAAALVAFDHLFSRPTQQIPAERRALFHFLRGDSLWHLDRLAEADQAYAAATRLHAPLANRTRASDTPEGLQRDTDRALAALAALLPRLPGHRPADAADTPPDAEPAPSTTPNFDHIVALHEAILAAHRHHEFDPEAPVYAEALALYARLLDLSSRENRRAVQNRRVHYLADAPGKELYDQAEQARQRREFPQAITLWTQAAEQGHAGALMRLGDYHAGRLDPEVETDPRQAHELFKRAAELDYPGAYGSVVDAYLGRSGIPRNEDRALEWARRGVALGDNHSAYIHYMVVTNQRRRNAVAAFTDQNNAQRELDAAFADLRDAALRGYGPALYELGRYHYQGEIPGIRAGNLSRRGDHSLPLARILFSHDLRDSSAEDPITQNSHRFIAEIDAALSLRKGRPWLVEEILAALDAKTPHHALAYLINREKADLYSDDSYRFYIAAPAAGIRDFSPLSMAIMNHTRLGGARMIVPEVDAAVARARAERRGPPPLLLEDSPALRARFAAGDPAAAYELYLVLRQTHTRRWPDSEPTAADLITQALSGDHPPAQWLRVRRERLLIGGDLDTVDYPRGVSLLRTAAEAGDADAAAELASLYIAYGFETGVRRNYAEAEYWLLQAIAHSHPERTWRGSALHPRNTLHLLYSFKTPAGLVPSSMSPDDEATLRWFRDLRQRGGAFADMADLKAAYFQSPHTRKGDIEPRIARLPTPQTPFAPDELRRLEQRAANDDLPALLALAQALAHGERGLRQDDLRAVALYQRAAALGDRTAMAALAEHFEKGYGVNKDLFLALDWRARHEGRTPAPGQTALAAARLANQSRDLYPLVEPYYLQAIEAGEVAAMRELAEIFANGRTLRRDEAKAYHWYRRAAEAGDARAMSSLALVYEHGRGVAADPAQVHYWRLRAAQGGHVGSMIGITRDFEQGERGAPRDLTQALRWAQAAAAAGDTSVSRFLLPRLERAWAEAYPGQPLPGASRPTPPSPPRTTPTDPASLYQRANQLAATDLPGAIALLRQSAAAEYPPALHQLGMVLLQGRGVERDPAAGLRFLAAAAEANVTPAQVDLARLLMVGIEDEIEADPTRAHALLRQAAEQRQNRAAAAAAAFLLGEAHDRGLGVVPDRDLALEWMELARDLGFPQANDALRRLRSADERGDRRDRRDLGQGERVR